MRRIVGTLVLVTLAAVLAGCQLAGAYAVIEFSLATELDELTIAKGGSAELVLRIDRLLGLDVSPLAVTVEIHRAPEGASLAEGERVSLPAGISEEPVTLEVDKAVEPGEHEVVLRGSNGVKSRDATVALTIEAAAWAWRVAVRGTLAAWSRRRTPRTTSRRSSRPSTASSGS